MKNLTIYTDASQHLDIYGISFVIVDDSDENEIRKNFKTTQKTLEEEFLIETPINPGSCTGEAYAILLALKEIDRSNKIRIYTDNLVVYEKINKLSKINKNNSLFRKILEECISLLNENIEICWIPAHSGIYHNEISDKLAGRARKNEKQPIFINTWLEYITNVFYYDFVNSFELDKVYIGKIY